MIELLCELLLAIANVVMTLFVVVELFLVVCLAANLISFFFKK